MTPYNLADRASVYHFRITMALNCTKKTLIKSFVFLVSSVGLEPTTLALKGRFFLFCTHLHCDA